MGEVHFAGRARGRGGPAPGHQRCRALGERPRLYTVACLPSGGIVDDLIVYRLQPDHYVMVVNASNIDKDVDWFQEHTRRRRATSQDAVRRDRADRVPGPGRRAGAAAADDVPARPAAHLQLRHGRDGRGAAGLDRAHRLHRRGRLRDLLRRAGRARAVGPAARGGQPPSAASRSGWARATRCASRRGCRSTATTSTRDHAARGGPRLGREARRRRLHRPRRAARAGGRGRRSASWPAS